MNAKELLLAKINAGMDFASMHVYLIILGYSEKEIAKYMTSPLVGAIKKLTEVNIFKDKTEKSTDTLLNNIKSISGFNISELKQFKDIYKDSKELTFLGSLVKVNQGAKATQEEVAKFSSVIQEGLVNSEKELFHNL